MNQIAQQLKERNIAEYLIYMWQEEDLIRANHCEPEELETNVIVRYPEDQRAAMREWYGNLITMMSEEGVREKGHLQINKNVILNLTELHNALSSSPKFPFYSAAYFKALPFIVELRTKNGKKEEPELETCFEALYGVLLLRLQKKPISEGTRKRSAKAWQRSSGSMKSTPSCCPPTRSPRSSACYPKKPTARTWHSWATGSTTPRCSPAPTWA